MNIACILPDHGGRTELIDFAKLHIARQTIKAKEVYHISSEVLKPNGSIDLVARLRLGYEMAKRDGMDFVFVWEDDFYPADYFQRFIPYMNFDFVGQNYTYYYQLKTRSWNKFDTDHKYRSSLFTTGFKVSALNHWDWGAVRSDLAMVDIKLWDYARRKTKAFIDTGAIGIKTGIGKCAGKGHMIKFQNQDPELTWLKERVDSEAFEFYKTLSEGL